MSAEIQSIYCTPVLVVIVNYRVADFVIDCLRSLVHEVQLLPGMKVIIVDNDSGDSSVEKITHAIETEGWESWASLIPSKINGGFAYGNNLGIRPALQTTDPPPYYLLLNPDTVVRPNAIKALVDFMENHPDVGITVSGTEDEHGDIWPYAYRFPSIWSELDSSLKLGIVSRVLSKYITLQKISVNKPQSVDWFQGACMMIRRQVFEEVGLMDEEYFLYYEETDFFLQAKRAGWSCWYVPGSRIRHFCGQSTGVTGSGIRKRLPQYWFDSRRRYFIKNHGLLYAALVDAVWIFGFSLWSLRRIIQRKPYTDHPHLFRDFLKNSVFLRFQ
jgi:GT2 family glycosyltransferase